MPFPIRFALVLALALAPAVAALPSPSRAADLPPIKEAVFFGDSLTDAGTYCFRFTTNPGLTWAQHVALHYGQPPLPNQHIDRYEDVYKGNHGLEGPGGLNYAEGGAKANSAYSTVSQDPEGKPISAVVQVQHHLRQHGGFSPDQLVTLYIGTNDVAWNYDLNNSPEIANELRQNRAVPPETMRTETARVEQAAHDEAQVAATILAHGAKRLVVFELPDLADLPWFHSEAARNYVRELSAAYDRRLAADLPRDPAILVLHTQAFFDDLFTHADRYGFTHLAHEDACREEDQDYCYPNSLKGGDADRTFVFAAGEHMTTRTNELLAEYVLRQVEASPIR